MINTSDFKTKTIFTERKNESIGNSWTIALDIGYSSVKGWSNNMTYCFPSYARKLPSKTVLTLGETSKNEIQYRDNETGELWYVGARAEDMIVSSDTRDSIAELYGRNRYFSDIFKVIARVGMGIGMLTNEYGNPAGKDVVLQTGLPPAYLNTDSVLLKEALSGHHNFSIKIGNKDWVSLEFTLPKENILVMAQPMGTLLSISTDNYGRLIPEATKYLNSSVLVLDAGFGTLDVYNIRNKNVESCETFDNLGMKRVLEETTKIILSKYNQEISIPLIQRYLQSGEIRTFDRKNKKTTLVPFGDILEKANKEICDEALAKIDTIYNSLFDHDYLVVTGGTGAAWFNLIKESYSGMDTLTVISGNQNDAMSSVFANVRGYYMFLLGKLRKAEEKSKKAQNAQNNQQSTPVAQSEIMEL